MMLGLSRQSNPDPRKRQDGRGYRIGGIVLRMLGWNALLLAAGVALAALAGEVYLRLTMPFMASFLSLELVPNVGYLRPPNTEIRYTNNLDFWTVSRINSLGFLDREPPSPERAKATCHISMIGDSFVEALEVPMEDKLQVRLEELAADRLPHLNVTTSAFGLSNTAQVHQLPFYDEYARRLHPKLLVLVFVDNDFDDNTPVLRTWRLGTRFEPIVRKRSDGELELAWSILQDRLPRGSLPLIARAARTGRKVMAHSWLALWLLSKNMFPRIYDYTGDNALFSGVYAGVRYDILEPLRRQPGFPEAFEFEGGRRITLRDMRALTMFHRRDLPPFFDDALQYTRFALEQFKQRADRDGVELVILATHTLKLDIRMPSPERVDEIVITRGVAFRRVSEMAATLDIPVIDQSHYILRQDADLTDAQWPHDYHWNPAGHQWAAEALLEYIEQRPEVCDLGRRIVTDPSQH